MTLSRYQLIDAYTLEELRREYQASDAKGRVRLLRKLYKDRIPPYEIVLMAGEDQNVEVRQWIARNGEHLDYQDSRNEFPDRNLEDRLRNDPDPFVRACLRENPKVFGSPFSDTSQKRFHEATHLERLALVRNPEVHDELIEKIFDPEDQELGINLEARQELIFALLTNNEFLAGQEMHAGLSGHPMPPDGLTWHSANKFLRTLWELTSKWPAESGIPYGVYRHVPVKDKTKEQIYRKCDNPRLRFAILENCDARDTETLALGMKDTDSQTSCGSSSSG